MAENGSAPAQPSPAERARAQNGAAESAAAPKPAKGTPSTNAKEAKRSKKLAKRPQPDEDSAAAGPSTSKGPTAKAGSAEAGASQSFPVKSVPKPKVVYDMPGQTRAKPDEEEPLAIFYTSLLQQRPDSELANKWCAACHAPVSAHCHQSDMHLSHELRTKCNCCAFPRVLTTISVQNTASDITHRAL